MRPTILVLFPLLALTACVSTEPHGDTAKSAQDAPAATQRDRGEIADRFTAATKVLNDFGATLPAAVKARTRCVAVIPAMAKGGFILGAKHGDGFATCRNKGEWSAPAPITISGASAGFQAGYESVDLMMLVTSDEGMKKLLRSNVELGGDVSVAAGPVGNGQGVDADATLRTEIVSYSRSRGLFAGAELSGAMVKQDETTTRTLYGATPEFHGILEGTVPPPPEASAFSTAVRAIFAQ